MLSLGVTEKAQDATAQLPVIRTDRQFSDVAKDSLHALRSQNHRLGLFYRKGRIVRLEQNEKGKPIIAEVTAYLLLALLTLVALFKKRCSSGGDFYIGDAKPSKDVVNAILALSPNDMVDWVGNSFPVLTTLTEIPAIRPDGSLILEHGYDAATGVYYHAKTLHEIPSVPDNPSREDVSAATAFIEDVIGDFPFDSEASKTNFVALLLTPILRNSIEGNVPIALIDAPMAGTGKSLLTDAFALLATGTEAYMQIPPTEDDEWGKVITASLQAGQTLMIFDNLNDSLESANLASAVTASEWTGRKLGSSCMLQMEQRATWVVTGNNIRLKGRDLPRRCFWIRLNAKTSKPWEGRTFRHADLKGYVRQHRSRIVAALLILIRAWYVAGKPQANSPVLGSFENWSIAVGGILSFAGLPGFLANWKERTLPVDTEMQEWESFLSVLQKMSQPFGVADVVEQILNTSSALRSVVPSDFLDDLGNGNEGRLRKRMGKAFASRVETPYGEQGLHIQRSTSSKRGSALWTVQVNRV